MGRRSFPRLATQAVDGLFFLAGQPSDIVTRAAGRYARIVPLSGAPIDRLRERFSPSDVGARFGWLYSWRAELPDAKIARTADYHAYDDELYEAQVQAVVHLVSSSVEGKASRSADA